MICFLKVRMICLLKERILQIFGCLPPTEILHTSSPTCPVFATSAVETQPVKIMSTGSCLLSHTPVLSTCFVMFLTPFGNNIGSCSASMESISSLPMVCSRTGELAKEMFGVSTNGLCFHNSVVEVRVELGLVEELSGFLWLVAGRT